MFDVSQSIIPNLNSNKENISPRNPIAKTMESKAIPLPSRQAEDSSQKTINNPVQLASTEENIKKTDEFVTLHLIGRKKDTEQTPPSPSKPVKSLPCSKPTISVALCKQITSPLSSPVSNSSKVSTKANNKLTILRNRLNSDRERLDKKGVYIIEKMPLPFTMQYVQFMNLLCEERIGTYSTAYCRYLHQEFKEFNVFIKAHMRFFQSHRPTS